METFLRAGLGNAVLATVLALGAASAGCLLRRRPAVRHGLWLLLLIKLITPPLGVIPLVGLEPASTGVVEIDTSEALTHEIERLDRSILVREDDEPSAWNRWVSHLPAVSLGPVQRARLAAVWLTGSIVALAVAGHRIRRWNRLLRLVGPASDDVQRHVEALAERMGIRRPPGAYWFPGPSAPMLWAFGCRARLIVPGELWERLDDRQRTTLLVHELAHLRRKDHWVRVIELIATALYWWLPLTWIARWALREAEEECCDAWVVWTCPDAHRTYAETLLDTVDFLSETGHSVPLAASGFGHAHHLKRRVTMIMQGETPRGLSRTGLLAMVGLSALLLPLSPTWAQKADGEQQAGAAKETRRAADEAERLTLDLLKAKLAELERLETKLAEKADPQPGSQPSEPSDASDRPKKSSGQDGEEAEVVADDDKEAPKPRTFKYHRRDEVSGRAEEVRARMEKGVADRALARAKAEVERARAQLRRAELQLAKLGADLKSKPSDPDRPSLETKGKYEKLQDTFRAKRDLEVHRKLEQIPKIKLDSKNLELKLVPKKDLFETVDKAKVGRLLLKTKDDLKLSEKSAELEAIREKFIEALRDIQARSQDIKDDPAVGESAAKLKSLVEKLERLQKLTDESLKKEREESR